MTYASMSECVLPVRAGELGWYRRSMAFVLIVMGQRLFIASYPLKNIRKEVNTMQLNDKQYDLIKRQINKVKTV